MQYSAFTSIWKVLVGAPDRSSLRAIESLLQAVLVENSVLRDPASFPSLLSSFGASESENVHRQLMFFDNCICRIAKKPVHYQDLVGSALQSSPGLVSPIVAAVTEQWLFVVKNEDKAVENAVGSWIATLLGKLRLVGESPEALTVTRDSVVGVANDKKTKSLLKKAWKDIGEVGVGEQENSASQKVASDSSTDKALVVDLEEIFGPLPVEGKTHNALHKWEKEDLELSVEQGRVGELMLCLCSEHEEIRRQAYANISRFMSKLKVSLPS
jgi:nucleolar pre-ribosomal-associated protein 1